jgi:hypothetical protein
MSSKNVKGQIINKGDIVRSKVAFARNGQVEVPRGSLGQVVDICEQEDRRGKHPFTYKIQWFIDESNIPVNLSIKWFSKCEYECKKCKDRFWCLTNKQKIEPLSPKELDTIKSRWLQKFRNAQVNTA